MAALFDYSRWDNIVDSDDDAPLMAAPRRPRPRSTRGARRRQERQDECDGAEPGPGPGAQQNHGRGGHRGRARHGARPTVASLQDALVKHGAGGQAAVLPLIAEARGRARRRQRARAARGDGRGVGAERRGDRRAHGGEEAAAARARSRSAGGVASSRTGVQRAGPGEDLVNVMLRTLEDAETRIAERIVASAAAAMNPAKKREDKARGFCVLDDVLAKEDADAISTTRALWPRGLRPARGDDGAAEAPLPVALGLPTIAALDASLFDVFERHEPDDEAAMAYAAVQAVVGVAYELERGLELDDALAVPDAVRLAAYAPDGRPARSARTGRPTTAPTSEVVAALFANPRDWSHADGGTLVVHDDAGAAHHVLPLPGRLVVYLARTVPVEDRPCPKRPRFSLSCAFDRRAPGYDVDDDDEDEDDATARDPEAFAYELAQKLKDQAERSGEAVSAKFMGPMYTDLGPSDVTVVEGATPFEPGDHDKENDIGLVLRLPGLRAAATAGDDAAAARDVADDGAAAPRVRRKRYAGRYPRNFSEKYKERANDAATVGGCW
ncbi:hypothetical protein JL720_13674 [Aureococcus anophagefferens]|nr:hypothetical protein JL720_13674 [Aureococcus anophagefferens]